MTLTEKVVGVLEVNAGSVGARWDKPRQVGATRSFPLGQSLAHSIMRAIGGAQSGVIRESIALHLLARMDAIVGSPRNTFGVRLDDVRALIVLRAPQNDTSGLTFDVVPLPARS